MMKLFLKKLATFILPPLVVWAIVEAMLPITYFTHRHSEAVTFRSKVPAKTICYPNIKSSKEAVGDLCHHTENAIVKHEYWQSDQLGFRNDSFVEQADVLIIGDSYVQGSSLSQHEIISNKLAKKLRGKLIYNMAPCNLSIFDRYLKTGVIKKPKLLIYSIVERDVPETFVPYELSKNESIKSKIKQLFSWRDINVSLDKILKHYSINWLQARINGAKGSGVQSSNNPQLFFLKGAQQKSLHTNLVKTSNTLLTYKNYCDSLGITFLFLPMPNKETVYYDFVPLKKQPTYLFELDSILKTLNIETINTLQIYNEHRSSHTEWLYHLDDTHWNASGVELISIKLSEKLEALDAR